LGKLSSPNSVERQREVWAEAVDLRQVLAEQRKERRANIELRAVRLPGACPDAVTATDRLTAPKFGRDWR